MIQLGCTVKDKISGFSGVVTGYVTYLTGCNQALVAPPLSKDGAHRDPLWFDEQRLVVQKTKVIELDNRGSPGFDKAPPKH